MSSKQFMLEWIVNPRIPLITVLVKEDDEETIYGCITAGTTAQFGSMPDYTPHLHPRAMEVFGAYFQFPAADGIIIELLYVAAELRGKEYGLKLYQVADDLAAREHKDCIAAFIWSCFPVSLMNATRNGYMVKSCINFPEPINMLLLYVEKRAENMAMKDYFHTPEYLDTKNMLFV